MSQCLIQQGLHMIVKEVIQGLAAASARSHQAKVAQDTEVLGNSRLCHVYG